jgi:hypothetical protein
MFPIRPVCPPPKFLYGDIFIMKMDENFNPMLAQAIQSNFYSECSDLTVNDHNEIFLSGVFTGSLFWDNHSLKGKGSFDILIAKLREDTSVSAAKPRDLHTVGGGNRNKILFHSHPKILIAP